MSPSLQPLHDLTVLLTGATRGIGRATAQALAAAGADVILNSRHADVASEIALAQVRAQGRNALHIAADVSQSADVEHLIETAWGWQGRVDVWINNAGADILSAGRYRLPWPDKLQHLWAVDVMGTVACCEAVGPRMQAQGHGHIINIGWDKAEQGGENTATGRLFALAKGGIMAYSRALALSLAPQVRVNCVAPGWIETAWGREVSSERKTRITRQIPLQRWGAPGDVAQAIVWLASPAAAYLTGQTINVNGGAVVR